MKFVLLFLILSVVIAPILAQCRQPSRQECRGLKDEGIGIWRLCRRTVTWWYDARRHRCERMIYKGCGGNNNRFCSLADCQRKCIRRG